MASIALLSSATAPQSDEAALDREIALRGLAYSLTQSATTSLALPERCLPIEVVAHTIDRVLPECEPWVTRFAVFDAAARAGLLLSGEGAFPNAGERPEIWAGQVRTFAVGEDVQDFSEALGTALAAPYARVREAALDRLTRALIDDERVGGDVLLELAMRPGVDGGTRRDLALVSARAGAGSSERVQAALAPWLSDLVAGGGDGAAGMEALFDEWLPRPLGHEGLEALRAWLGPSAPLVEALALVGIERDGVEHLTAPSIDAVTELFRAGEDEDRAERVARHARSAALGRALAARAADSAFDVETRVLSARGAAWSLPVDELLTLAMDFGEDEAVEVWAVLGAGERALPGAAVLPWLDDQRDTVREAAAREVGRRMVSDPPSVPLDVALTLLDDGSAELRSLAFSWYCDVGATDRFGADLRTAFDAEAVSDRALSPRQARWLARLPRDRGVAAFRDVVVRLVEEPATRDPSIIEILRTFPADDEVDALLGRVLEEELRSLVRASTYVERLVPDGRAAAVVKALAAVRGDTAVPAIADALERSMELMHGAQAGGDARPQLPKTACGLLSRTGSGRAALVPFLADDVPRRVRFEAALQLAKSAGTDPPLALRLGARLIADHGGVDGTLRMRGIAALGLLAPVEDPVVDAFLGQLAQGARGDDAERHAAIAALGRRGALRLLAAVASRPLGGAASGLDDLDAAVAAARSLGDPAFAGRGVVVAREMLALIRAVDARLDSVAAEELEADALEQLRGALLVSTCRGISRRSGSPGPTLDGDELDEVLRAVARGPLESSRRDIVARLEGEDLADVRFRWSSEIEAASSEEIVATKFAWNVADAWSEPPHEPLVDGRLLLVLGDLRARQGALGFRVEWFLQTGLFSVLGEPRDREANRDLALGRAALVGVHARTARDGFRFDGRNGLERDDWDAAALQTIRLLADSRRGRVRRQILETLSGVSDPAVPRDAEARLAAFARIYRARAVLARTGDSSRAMAWLDAARPWARLDGAAAAELAALDAEIVERNR